jgi:colanic acid biosynthesis protein WcaH
MGKIGREEFIRIVEKTPLVSIDLVTKNSAGQYLLGLRMNEPARNSWFVPGSRFGKGERISEAFKRITKEELGQGLCIEDARFLGVFEHIYETNFAEEPGFGTHYVVLAYEVAADVQVEELPMDQHSEWRYFTVEELLREEKVHENTRNYFVKRD